MRLPKLDKRLSVIAALVREGVRVVDVGTDHGYLIAWLTAGGKIPGGCACDINQKPLGKAAFSLREYGVQDRVRLVLCDGLSGVTPECGEDIVIAGMGGDTIWHILSQAPWVRNPRYRLLLQPMTKAPLLRRKLYENGFAILREQAVVSSGFPYTVMVVSFTGVCREVSPAFAWGGLLQTDTSPAAKAYMARVLRLLTQKVKGLAQARTAQPAKLEEYEKLLAALQCAGSEPLEEQ